MYYASIDDISIEFDKTPWFLSEFLIASRKIKCIILSMKAVVDLAAIWYPSQDAFPEADARC